MRTGEGVWRQAGVRQCAAAAALHCADPPLHMKNPQILSAIDGAAAPLPPPSAQVFDACELGVVLRAVLFVQAVLAVALMYLALDAPDWLARLGFVTSGALPATLLWLLATCALKALLARRPWPIHDK